jgi:hypothetical protein
VVGKMDESSGECNTRQQMRDENDEAGAHGGPEPTSEKKECLPHLNVSS